MSRPIEDTGRRAYLVNLEWKPLAILVAISSAFVAVTIASLFVLGLAAIPIAIVLVDSFLLFFVVWIGIYGIVEYALWRSTRNPGHRLQYLGVALILLPLSYSYIMLFLGGISATFSMFGFITTAIGGVSFIAGLGFSLYGYYHRGYRAGDIDLYRNVVVREGERIGELTDGYSTRIFSTRYDELAKLPIRAAATEYAKEMGRAGLMLSSVQDDEAVTFYPMTYTGVGGFHLWTALEHLYWLSRKPERLTWVRIAWDGSVKVHISPHDYERISRPVAYHLLCAGVGDALVSSLVAFAGGDTSGSVLRLLGQRGASRPATISLVRPDTDRLTTFATMLTAALLVTGLGASIAAGILSPERQGIQITNVAWTPTNPAPGDRIDLYASVTGGDAFGLGPLDVWVAIFTAFNDTLSGALPMVQISSNQYGVRLMPFHDGTAVTLLVTARYFVSGAGARFTWSGPYDIDIGTVHRDGASGLTIAPQRPTVVPTGDVQFAAWINSSAGIESSMVMTYSIYSGWSDTGPGGSGSVSGGGQVISLNLTGSNGFFSVGIPASIYLPYGMPHYHAVIYYRFVARDTTWNTAATSLMSIEVNA